MNTKMNTRMNLTVDSVEEILTDGGINVLAIRKRQFSENMFVFETDGLTGRGLNVLAQELDILDAEVNVVTVGFQINAIWSELNHGEQVKVFDDTRVHVDITVKELQA